MTGAEPELPLPKIGSGKVRELYAVDHAHVLMVASDRISAYDAILPTPIPGKGEVLTQLSVWWFERLADLLPHHLVSADLADYPAVLRPFAGQLRGRSMLCRRLAMVPVECVARGYLAGSGWTDYQATGSVCGHRLPPGLSEGAALAAPLFTPATKATAGHDENIGVAELAAAIGGPLADRLERLTLRVYQRAAALAAARGLLLADTKLEFGHDREGVLTLADEVLTPDSSRYWPADDWRVGAAQPSFDKQYVRDWLRLESGWDRAGPPPPLPPSVVEATAARYREAYVRLTGEEIDV